MNSSMEEESNILHFRIHVAAGITFTVGLIINGFIVAVNVTDWMKGRPLTATDHILTSLGITRMLYQSACLLEMFYHIFFEEYPVIYNTIVDIVFTITFYVGIWLANLLSVVFCLKISDFRNACFLHLKTIILQRVTHLIIASVLGCFCYISIYNLIGLIEIPDNSSNKTHNREIRQIKNYMFFLWTMVPFLMFLVSSVLLISSLCHHMNRMRGDRTVTGQLDAYYKTIKFSMLSSLSYTFYFAAALTLWFHPGPLDSVGSIFILNFFPTLHSTYLIYVTTKLRNRFSVILRHGTSCWPIRQAC